MAVNDLVPWFSAEELNKLSEDEQKDAFYKLFKEDFIDEELIINGKKVRVIKELSKIPGFRRYPETFAHVVTRELKSQKERFYEVNRSNRVHWIRPILESHPCADIKYFKRKDERGVCKEYYWLIFKGFIVILKDVAKDVQIVTAFCVDEEEKLTYFGWFKEYTEGKSEC
jgi:hypothetical protein